MTNKNVHVLKNTIFFFLLLIITNSSANNNNNNKNNKNQDNMEEVKPDNKLTKNEVDELLQGTNPCACALLNFWDSTPREEAAECCAALDRICYFQKNTIKCGHVHRFCMKKRAGFSAWVLDTFVREKLTLLVKEYNMTCDVFNPDATHENELCGNGYCKFGYYCAEIKATKCKKTKTLPCGDGYCPIGTQCAEMASESCKKIKQKKLKDMEDVSFSNISCKDDQCKICTEVTEHKCAYESKVKEPCKDKTCSSEVACDLESSYVCQMRPDAEQYLANSMELTHAPEKVDKKYLRFTAFVLPTIAGIIALIGIVALVSWMAIRVRRAKKESGFSDDKSDEGGVEYNKSNNQHRTKLSKGQMSVEDVPLTPTSIKSPIKRNMADIMSPRLRLSLNNMKSMDGTPKSEKRSARSIGKILFSPRSPYQNMDDGDMNTVEENSDLQSELDTNPTPKHKEF